METNITALQQEVARLGALSGTEAERCPYRETIARAVNSADRIERMEQKIDKLTEAVTRQSVLAGLSGGGATGIIGLVAYGVGKAAGWW